MLVGQVQRQDAGESSNRHPDLVGQLQAATALPFLLGDKDANAVLQAVALCLVEVLVVGHMLP